MKIWSLRRDEVDDWATQHGRTAGKVREFNTSAAEIELSVLHPDRSVWISMLECVCISSLHSTIIAWLSLVHGDVSEPKDTTIQ